jgi:peptide/nickel transport system permease protein
MTQRWLLVAIARRLSGLVATLFVTSVIVFGSLYLVPGSPISYLTGRTISNVTVAQVTAEYHLNQPFPQRYWEWLIALLHGNFGTSLVYQQSTWQLLAPRLGSTLLLVLLSALEIVGVGTVLGIVSARRGKVVDAAITVITTIGIGVPTFAAAVVLIFVFGVTLRWFPVAGVGTGFWGTLDHVFLPSVALAISGVAYVGRLTRTAVRDEQSSEYVDTAIARGLTNSEVLRRHILRNAAPSILTAAGVSFVGVMASEVVVEGAFGVNGVGSLLISSVGLKDFAVVQFIVLLYVALFMVVNTAVDLIAMRIDPRIALAAGHA